MTSPTEKKTLSEIQDEEDDATTVYLVDDGDLKLHVNCSRERRKRLRGLDLPVVYQKTFVVSSTVMRIASPVWRAMFDPQSPFMDTQRSLTHGEMDLPEDDADALLYVLRIAHLQFRRIPETLDFIDLLNVAIICDKYDTVSIVRPWIAKWEREMKELISYNSFEGYLFIAWAFGDYPTYAKLANAFVYECTTDRDGRLLNTRGNLIGDNFPPAAVDTILEARQTSIAALLDACHKLVDSYQSHQVVCQATGAYGTSVSTDERKECDTLVFGSLVKGLKSLGIWPTILTSEDYHGSVSELIKGLRSLHCFVLDGRTARYPQHGNCKFTQKLHSEITRIKEHVVPSGVHDSHREHMNRQAEK